MQINTRSVYKYKFLSKMQVPFLGEVKARPIDIISFSLGYLSKSRRADRQYRQAPPSRDTPAEPSHTLVVPYSTILYSTSFLLDYSLSFRLPPLTAT